MPKKVNRITSLEDDHGNKVTENSSVSMVAKNYFMDFFQKKNNVTEPVITKEDIL